MRMGNVINGWNCRLRNNEWIELWMGGEMMWKELCRWNDVDGTMDGVTIGGKIDRLL